MKNIPNELVIIGAGPGGYACAFRASDLGIKVTLIEKEEKLGGTCLNIGCIPSKALLHSSEKYNDSKKHFEEHGIKFEKIELNLETLMKRKEKILELLFVGLIQQIILVLVVLMILKEYLL